MGNSRANHRRRASKPVFGEHLDCGCTIRRVMLDLDKPPSCEHCDGFVQAAPLMFEWPTETAVGQYILLETWCDNCENEISVPYRVIA